MADLKGLIETVARALSDHPEAISVRESQRRGMTVFELHVAPGDSDESSGAKAAPPRRCGRCLASAAEDDDRRVSLDIRDASGRS